MFHVDRRWIFFYLFPELNYILLHILISDLASLWRHFKEAFTEAFKKIDATEYCQHRSLVVIKSVLILHET